MKAIYKREVSSYFNSMIGWIFVAVLTVFIGIYFFAYNLFQGYPYFSLALGSSLFIFMVVFNVLSTVLGNILVNISPLLTLVVTGVFSLLVLVLCVFALIGIIHAAKGQRKPVPIIGGITIIK